MLPQQIKQTLIAARPFRYLDERELEELINYSRFVHYVNGEYILKQGQHADGMYIIMKGIAVITALVLGSKNLEFAQLNDGDFIGEVSLIVKGLSSISVMASNEVDCLLVSANYFEMLSVFFPHIKYKISRAITEDVCNRHLDNYERIVELIEKTNILTESFLAEIVKSQTTTQDVSYESVHLDMQHLKSGEFFHVFTDEEFNEILKNTTLLNAPKDCLLIKENEIDISYFLILRGAVQISIGNGSRLVKCSVLGPLEFFGNMSLIIDKPSKINFLTCERAVVLKFSAKTLEHFKTHHSAIWYKLYDYICRSFVLLEDAERKLLIRLNSEIYNR